MLFSLKFSTMCVNPFVICKIIMASSFGTLRVAVEGLEEGKERGRGCYGAVYEVRLHGLPCIAKRLHDILVGRGREERISREQRRAVIESFREECVLLSRLRHPNVVQFMGVHYGRDEADISLIMEYMHMDLEQCMKTYMYNNIPLPYKTSILRDVAYGLAYLHSTLLVGRWSGVSLRHCTAIQDPPSDPETNDACQPVSVHC